MPYVTLNANSQLRSHIDSEEWVTHDALLILSTSQYFF